jgi:hypothetical protein
VWGAAVSIHLCASASYVRIADLVRLELQTFLSGEPLSLLTDYYKHFGDKPCCFADIRPYLWLLGEQPQGEFLAAVSNMAGLPCRESSADGSIAAFAANVE